MFRMIEAVLVAVVLAYFVVRSIHWFDQRAAKRIRAAREKRHNNNVIEEARSNVLHGWH